VPECLGDWGAFKRGTRNSERGKGKGEGSGPPRRGNFRRRPFDRLRAMADKSAGRRVGGPERGAASDVWKIGIVTGVQYPECLEFLLHVLRSWHSPHNGLMGRHTWEAKSRNP